MRCRPQSKPTSCRSRRGPALTTPDALPAGSSSQPARYAAFKFAEQQAEEGGGGGGGSSSFNLDSIQQGRILVSLYHAQHVGPENPDRPVHGADLGGGQQELQLPEGKKFFLAPSLKCAAGGTKTGAVWSKERYQKVGRAEGGARRCRAAGLPGLLASHAPAAPRSGPPAGGPQLGTGARARPLTRPPARPCPAPGPSSQVGPAFLELELRYETASTLLLRKVLDPGKPAHAAILAEYGDSGGRLGPGAGGWGPGAGGRARPLAVVAAAADADAGA